MRKAAWILPPIAVLLIVVQLIDWREPPLELIESEWTRAVWDFGRAPELVEFTIDGEAHPAPGPTRRYLVARTVEGTTYLNWSDDPRAEPEGGQPIASGGVVCIGAALDPRERVATIRTQRSWEPDAPRSVCHLRFSR